MTITDATYLNSTILSFNDPRVQDKKYLKEDKFILKQLDDSFSKEINLLLEDKDVILEVLGYVLTSEAKVLYDMKRIEVESKCSFRWLLSEEELKESFLFLGNNYQHARFILLEIDD